MDLLRSMRFFSVQTCIDSRQTPCCTRLGVLRMAVRRELRQFPQDAFAFVDRIERLSQLDDVASAMEETLAPFGIDSFIVTGLPTQRRPFEELVMASRWPPEFFMLYIEND